MPGRVKVRILSARDLPVMDRASELTDAFVEVRFGSEIYKTEVCKKSLNPQWNSEWFKFEVDDEVLQDEPLDLRVLDYDTYSAHDTIGKVYIDLNPLLSRENPNIISGWFPIYDTLQGLRGELNIQVRVELFSDFNKFRQSSCGIQFFCTCAVPSGWRVQNILGFIEELVVNDDPEYQWIEKIRTPRASNEARQRLFSKLSGTLQRKLGVKVMEMGGNAVLGYFQNFDLEGESGIVVRAIGTAVTITRLQLGQLSPAVASSSSMSPVRDMRLSSVNQHHRPHQSHHRQDKTSPSHTPVKKTQSSPSSSASPSPKAVDLCPPVPASAPLLAPHQTRSDLSHFTFPYSNASSDDNVAPTSSSPAPSQQQQHGQYSVDVVPAAVTTTTTVAAASSAQQLNPRRSSSPVRTAAVTENKYCSESEIGSPPKAVSAQTNPVSNGMAASTATRQNYSKTSVLQQSIDLLEYPFFTLRSFPVGFIRSFGGVVSARSVKLLDKIHNPEEPETRDAWWSEVRTEIKLHAAKLGCHAVLGYMEQTTICDEVIVLSAVGTAAKINLNFDLTQLPVTSGPGSQGPSTPNLAAVATDKDMHGGAEKERDKEKYLFVDTGLANQGHIKTIGPAEGHDDSQPRCSLCHIPYSPSSMPFEIQLSKCAICKKKNVPEVLFATVDPPENMLVWSKGCLIQARICRAKSKNKSSEQSAREISDSLPFIEYEIHNQLINKLKIRGLNCLFGLRIQICVGENMLVAVATATGAYLGPLPAPPQPKISTEVATAQESRDLITLQKKITRAVQVHRERLGSEIGERQPEHNPHSIQTDEETDEEEGDGSIFLEPTKDKNTFVLVIDDLKDDTVSLILQDVIPPEGYEMCNTQTPPGIPPDRITANLQMFTQMVRVRYQPTSTANLDFSDVFNTILRRLFFKLRYLRPCCLTDMCFNVDLPDEDEIVIAVTGCCLGLQYKGQSNSAASASVPKLMSQVSDVTKSSLTTASSLTEDMMFPLDGVADQVLHTAGSMSTSSSSSGPLGRPQKQLKDADKPRGLPPLGIELTPLNVVYNGRIEKYLGYYNFFFIRESTSVKEVGGVGGFMQSFIMEVHAIVRAHVAALGGNALVAYNMSQFLLENNPHKNQGQCMINVNGDVVVVLHGGDKEAVLETPFLVPAS
ncbi:hypothetical protein BsWGS_19017 [Bradybaena similaris]